MDSTTFGGLSFVVAACRLLSGRADEVYSIDIYDVAVRDAAPSVCANLPPRLWTPEKSVARRDGRGGTIG